MAFEFDSETLDALRRLYDALDREIDRIHPPCRKDGDCCRFARSGLQLFVTPLETAYLIAQEDRPHKRLSWDVCPYQIASLCTAREGRPLGCRIYYCDPRSESALEPLSQRFHAALKQLHDRFGIAYRYEPLHQSLKREWDEHERNVRS